MFVIKLQFFMVVFFLGRYHKPAADPGEGAGCVDVELVRHRSPYPRPHVLKRIRRRTSPGRNIVLIS
jgi:hypothetical protein